MAVAPVSAAETGEVLRPDGKFIADVIRLGGASAKKCFQCGTCTVSCNVSYAREGDEPFPRRLILATQWGLKDRVLSDPALWACHQCNDCSANCPRGAKPGDVMAALRTLAIERYAVPGFLARAYREPQYLPLIFGVPLLMLLALLYAFQGLTYPAGDVVYKRFIPDVYIEVAGILVAGLAVLAAAVGLLRFWRDLRLGTAVPGPGTMAATPPLGEGLESTFAATMADIVKHRDFQACSGDNLRMYGHMGVFFGTPFLLFATALAALYSLLGLELDGLAAVAVKVTGNLGGVMLLGGVLLLGYNRLRARQGDWGAARYQDWLFILLIFVNVFTGMAVQLARVANVPAVAYPVYVVHLAIVFASFLYLPYGKLAHAYYRAAALTALRHGGKTSPYKLYVLLPAALAAGVGGVAAVVGLVLGLLWLVQGAPVALGELGQAGLALSLYLPVANVNISLLLVVAVGFGVGLLSGMTGVGGGFIMTPLLMMIGIPSTAAVGTDNTQVAGTASSGALAHWRLGNVDVKLGLTILAGSLIGGTIGVQIVALLRAVGNFDFWVRIIYVVVLGTVGSLMLRESVQTWARSVRDRMIAALVAEGFEELRRKVDTAVLKPAAPLGRFTAGWPLQTEFRKAHVRASLLFPFGLGLTVGTLAAIMGVGGGFIMVPAMIYILGVPTHVAVGTDLFQMVFTATNLGFQQAVVNHNVDVILAVLLIVGSSVGAQVGARLGYRMAGHQLRTFLGTIVMLVMLKMLLDIVLPPGYVIDITSAGGGGH